MSEQENVQLIRGALAAFAGGDAQSFLNLFSEEVDFQHPMPLETSLWAGEHRGRARVAHALGRLARLQNSNSLNLRNLLRKATRLSFCCSNARAARLRA